MVFIDKVEVLKQYRQTVINSGNNEFILPIERKFLRLQIMTIVAVYEKNPEIWYG